MRTYLSPMWLVVLAACTGGTYDQGKIDISNDTGSEADADTDSDTDTDTDTDTDADTDTELCTNDWHPVYKTGWRKEFVASGAAGDGTGFEEYVGRDTSPDGYPVFLYRDSLTNNKNTDGYNGVVSVSCDPDGMEGMFVESWEGIQYGNFNFKGLFEFPFEYEFEAVPLTPFKYLPTEFVVGGVGSWDYTYDMDLVTYVKGKPSVFTQTVTGSFLEAGFEQLTLFDGTTVEAYKLTHSYSITIDFGLGSQEQQEGYVEQYWVKGLGLVKEVFEDETKGSVLMTKELSAYEGLEIVK